MQNILKLFFGIDDSEYDKFEKYYEKGFENLQIKNSLNISVILKLLIDKKIISNEEYEKEYINLKNNILNLIILDFIKKNN